MTEIIMDIETNGFEAVRGPHRVTCIALIRNGITESCSCEDEIKIIEGFWKVVDDGDTLITFHGDEFDIPFIIKRSLILNIPIKRIKSLDLRKVVNSFDLSYDKYVKGTLNEWALLLGMSPKLEDGGFIVDAFNARQFDIIKNHCEYDVKITEVLYKRCKECNLL